VRKVLVLSKVRNVDEREIRSICLPSVCLECQYVTLIVALNSMVMLQILSFAWRYPNNDESQNGCLGVSTPNRSFEFFANKIAE
jgi:hypothetical protein